MIIIFEKASINDLNSLVELRIEYLTEDYEDMSEPQITRISERLPNYYHIKLLLSDSEKMGLDFVELKATDAGYNLYKSIGFENVISKYHNMKILLDSKNKF
ncbi:MAG: hypothetical protein K2G83_01570 [Ruminococcus sp.]|nr:hypothetical protein [Ruminococcus sp.]